MCCCTKCHMRFPLSEAVRGIGVLAVKHASHILNNKSLDGGVSRRFVRSARYFTNLDCARAGGSSSSVPVSCSSSCGICGRPSGLAQIFLRSL